MQVIKTKYKHDVREYDTEQQQMATAAAFVHKHYAAEQKLLHIVDVAQKHFTVIQWWVCVCVVCWVLTAFVLLRWKEVVNIAPQHTRIQPEYSGDKISTVFI